LWSELTLLLPYALGGEGVFWISSDDEVRMGTLKAKKNPSGFKRNLEKSPGPK